MADLLLASQNPGKLEEMRLLAEGLPFRVIGPRQGKSVEIQALWYNALRLLSRWRDRRGKESVKIAEAANACRASFHARFWIPGGGHCYDLVDGPNGDDPEPRPNQLLTASLSCPLLDRSHWHSMLRVVEQWLLMPPPLAREPSPDLWDDLSGGRSSERRARGTYARRVTPWLVGPYADVVRRVRGEAWDVRPILNYLVRQASRIEIKPGSETLAGDASELATVAAPAAAIHLPPHPRSIRSVGLGRPRPSHSRW